MFLELYLIPSGPITLLWNPPINLQDKSFFYQQLPFAFNFLRLINLSVNCIANYSLQGGIYYSKIPDICTYLKILDRSEIYGNLISKSDDYFSGLYDYFIIRAKFVDIFHFMRLPSNQHCLSYKTLYIIYYESDHQFEL